MVVSGLDIFLILKDVKQKKNIKKPKVLIVGWRTKMCDHEMGEIREIKDMEGHGMYYCLQCGAVRDRRNMKLGWIAPNLYTLNEKRHPLR